MYKQLSTSGLCGRQWSLQGNRLMLQENMMLASIAYEEQKNHMIYNAFHVHGFVTIKFMNYRILKILLWNTFFLVLNQNTPDTDTDSVRTHYPPGHESVK